MRFRAFENYTVSGAKEQIANRGERQAKNRSISIFYNACTEANNLLKN
jgi:hypothetical protein